MKFLLSLTFATSLASAIAVVSPDAAPAERRKVRRPQPYGGPVPVTKRLVAAGAPEGYSTSTGRPTVTVETANLQKLPSDLIDVDSPDAAIPVLESRRVLRKLRGLENRQVTAADFYECRDSSPAPTSADCNTVIDEVYAASQSLTITASACLLFQYGTCWGFFCSLCTQLSTTTDFVASQLTTADTLCVSGGNGQTGTVVGEDAPQWEAGFVYAGDGLPNYADVC